METIKGLKVSGKILFFRRMYSSDRQNFVYHNRISVKYFCESLKNEIYVTQVVVYVFSDGSVFFSRIHAPQFFLFTSPCTEPILIFSPDIKSTAVSSL